MAFMMVFSVNADSKQYVFANRILVPSYLQFLQQKEDYISPDTCIEVRSELVMSYEEFQEFYKRFNSTSIG